MIASKWSSKLGMVFIDGGHSIDAAMTDYVLWKSKILSNGALVIHDIFENPEDGGRPPFEIFQRALASKSFVETDRVGSLRVLKRVGPNT